MISRDSWIDSEDFANAMSDQNVWYKIDDDGVIIPPLTESYTYLVETIFEAFKSTSSSKPMANMSVGNRKSTLSVSE